MAVKQDTTKQEELSFEEKRKIRLENREKLVKQRQVRKERKQKRIKLAVKYLSFVVIVLVLLAVIFGKKLLTVYNLLQEKEQREQELKSREEQIQRLEEEYSRVSTPEYIERQARFLLRMIRPGEVLYVVKDDE